MNKKYLSIFLAASFVIGAFAACNGEATSDLSAFDDGATSTSEAPALELENVVDFVLEVEAGRDVKILQLTDIQIIDSSQQRYEGRLHSWSIDWWAPEKMEFAAWRYMREAVAAVQPDLIVLSGDNVYGEFDDNGTVLQALVAEMESYEIPWTITFGNHDNETRKGMEWTCAQYIDAEHCMFTRGDIRNVEGNGNFNIGITQGGELTEVVWLMDSNGHTAGNLDKNMYSAYGLQKGQIAWFTQRNELLKEYNGGVSPKSIGFFHHPLRALGDALTVYGYESAQNAFMDKYGDWGTFTAFTIPENDKGDCGAMNSDPDRYIDANYQFHNLLKEYGCEGWFFGHHHKNNASASFEGVRYTYGLKASTYDEYQDGEVGGTEILVGADKTMSVRHVYTQFKTER